MYKKLAVLVGALSLIFIALAVVIAYDWLANRGIQEDDGCCHHDGTTTTIVWSVSEDTSEPAPATDEGEVANPAPDFTMLDLDGNEVLLSDFFGRPIVLSFWTTTCPACVVSIPPIQQLYDDMGQEVQVLMVNLQQPIDTVENFMTDNMYNFPVYIDTREGATRYEVQFIPTTFFIDARGDLVYSHVGAVYDELIARGLSAAGVE